MAGAGPLSDPPFQSIGALLQSHRGRAPNRQAILDLDSQRSITFAELADVADVIAARLRARGVAPGARVLLAGGNGIDKLLLWIGLWRLGAVVCPLDPGFAGIGVLRSVAAILQPRLVLLPSSFDTTAFAGCALLHYGRWGSDAGPDELALAAGPVVEALPACGPDAADLASICCTSGTSGEPKLLLYDHGCYWNNGLDTIDAIGLTADDRLLEYRSFDWYSAQILSLMPCLIAGITLCVAPRFSRRSLPGWIRRGRISVCVGVPAVVNILLEAPLPPASLAGVRAMTCSSAPLARLQWERFEALYGVEILNMYGSSEAGWMCANRPGLRRMGSVGLPLRRIGFDVLDPEGRPCPPGQPGQVVVEGGKLVLGLLRADGSISPVRGAPFAMRDAAMRDADGFVTILGRTDDLIIRGGVKIAPQEIEEVLLAHPDVADAAALGVPDPVYGQEPACFVVPHAHGGIDIEALLAWCAQSLPREKRPKSVQVLEALPRNARGKLVRDELRRRWWRARIPGAQEDQAAEDL
jgi:acyl-CoA synthetase (AMP-forming)/AMP-acid ligase II